MGKLLFDMFPLLLFFAAYKFYDVYVATAVAIIASIALILWLKVTGKPVEKMQWLALGVIVVFGGLTLALNDPTFIKLKPSVLYFAFALILIGGRLFAGKDLIKSVMGGQINMPDAQWTVLNWAWISFFVAMALLNMFIAYTYSMDTWVQFKVFGAMALTFVFIIAQVLWMSRYMVEEEKTSEDKQDTK
jgi:intracellular septation protein